MNKISNKNNPEFWIGKICGSKNQIKNAIESMDTLEPIDSEEYKLKLQKKIFEQIGNELEKVLKQAEDQHQYTPY